MIVYEPVQGDVLILATAAQTGLVKHVLERYVAAADLVGEAS